MRCFALCLLAVCLHCPVWAMGYLSDADTVRFNMEVLAKESRDGYECRLVEYNTDSSERVRAYLLVPDDACQKRCPALVLLHDHGARFDIGKEKLVSPITAGNDCFRNSGYTAPEHIVRSSRQWVEKNFDGAYMADSLAASGYVVLVSDALYWGERSSEDARRWSELSFGELCDASSECYRGPAALKDTVKALKDRVYEGQRRIYAEIASDGDVWAEKILRDDMSSVALLAGLPEVDEKRIGAFGFSMGAHRCWLLAAFCSSVRCGAAVSWMTLKEASDTTSASSLSMVIPSLREKYDFPDIALMLSPKPMLFMSGTQDHLFPENIVREAFERMQEIYRISINEKDPYPLQTEFFTDGHHCGKSVQARVANFFDWYLKENMP